MMKPTPQPVRCAIYTRKSTEEGLDQEFNSLDAQRASSEAFIQSQVQAGWVCLPQAYDDGGYTGANMERPALQRLLADIDAGVIDAVVCYKLDRLSRSLLDFAKMMERFEQRGIAFVSITQQFNSATSMGRLVLNMLLSFAQFEREIIGERTRDKIAAARRQGKWVGGVPLLGFDLDSATRKRVVNAAEAKQVQAIFDLYLQHEGLVPVVRELTRRGWNTKRWTTRKGHERGGMPFTKTALQQLLTNVVTSANCVTAPRFTTANTRRSSHRKSGSASRTCCAGGDRKGRHRVPGHYWEAWYGARHARVRCARGLPPRKGAGATITIYARMPRNGAGTCVRRSRSRRQRWKPWSSSNSASADCFRLWRSRPTSSHP
jgi:DNA invertase Pin-like site-specific DNA recombinase